jgi:hypothetical protein
MVFPESFNDRLKYFFWKLYTPYHPFIRETVFFLKLVAHTSHQDFVLGKIAPNQSMEEFIAFLIEQGFKRHSLAWKFPGEVVSLRYAENFSYQYHLRIFADGEIRGHYEYTPECKPISHLRAIGMEDRRHVFLSVLGDRVVTQ